MKIRLIGQRNTSGIGTHYAHFADQLLQIYNVGKLVEEVDFTDQFRVQQAANESQPDDINICFVAMNNMGSHFRGTNIQWVVFESTKIPDNILEAIQDADQIWVPSDWGRGVLINNGIVNKKIHVVPEGVDSNKFHNHGRRPWTSARPFRFLTVGKYEQRKGIDEALEAFAQVHGNRPDLELVIKSNYFTNRDQKLQDLQKKISTLGLTNVTVLWGDMTTDELSDLYRSCDTFVLPSRAEGWGLPLIEAAATGLPVITTMYSGHTEFLSHIKSSVLPVDFVITPIDCPEYCFYYPDAQKNWGNWARPDVYAVASCMQAACREVEILYKQAQKNSQIIRQRFGWANSAEKALEAMGF
jgi:glycosyltransferase involved in cell wall biosynthesis